MNEYRLIQQAAQAHRGPMKAAMIACERASDAVLDAEDIVVSFQAAANLILAAETLQERAEALVKAMRAKLATVMDETGAPTIRTDTHTISVSRAPNRVWVQDETQLPPQFWVQPPKKPDVDAIKAALKQGDVVPGAVMAGNGEPRLMLRARKAA